MGDDDRWLRRVLYKLIFEAGPWAFLKFMIIVGMLVGIWHLIYGGGAGSDHAPR